MSQAEALLNNLTDEQIATYTAAPGPEPHIVVGADRVIAVPEELRRLAVQHDHDIETYTFDCPRYWDEHDLSTMKIYINYMCPDNTPGTFIAENIATDESDENIIHFTWTISRNVTTYKGDISFLVCAKTTDEEGNEKYHWNSELNKDCYVSEGLETTEVVLNNYPDIITQLLIRMETVEEDWDIFEEEVKAEVALLREHVVGQGFVSRYGDTMEGTLMMPAGADAPLTETVSNAYTVRQAGGTAAIVDGSMTEVLKIEGNSAPSENLITYPYNISSATVNGVEVTVNSNGSIKLNGQASAGKDLILNTWPGGKIFNGTYTISCGTALPQGSFFWVTGVKGGKIQLLTAGNKSAQIVIDDVLTEIGIWMSVDGNFSNCVVYPMLVKGSVVKPYKKGVKGLRNASIKAIKYTGKNVLNIPEELTFTKIQVYNGIMLPAGTYSISCESYEMGGTDAPAVEITDSSNQHEYVWVADYGTKTFTLKGGTYKFNIYSNGYNYVGSEGVTSTIRKLMLNLGDPIPYEPYTEELYQLPKTVECGLGTVIDIPNRKVTNYGVDLVLTGEENWELPTSIVAGCSSYRLAKAFDITPVDFVNSDGLPNYPRSIYGEPPHTSKVTSYGESTQLIIVVDNSLAFSNGQTDTTAWKNYLAQRYAAGDPFTIRYVSQNVQSEEDLDDIPLGYTVTEGGAEAIVADDTGAILTDVAPAITQVYHLHTSPDEVATQAYIDRGLAKKASNTYVDAKISKVNKELANKLDDSDIPEIQKHSDDASAVNGLALTKDANGILRIGDLVIPYRKPIWTRNKELVPGTLYDSLAGELDGAAFNATGTSSNQVITLPSSFDDDTAIYIKLGIQEMIDVQSNSEGNPCPAFGQEFVCDCGAFYPGHDRSWTVVIPTNSTMNTPGETVDSISIGFAYTASDRSFTVTTGTSLSVKAIYQTIG